MARFLGIVVIGPVVALRPSLFILAIYVTTTSTSDGVSIPVFARYPICLSLLDIRILIPLSSGASLITYIYLIPIKSVVGSTFAVARLIAQPEARNATTINRLKFKNVLRLTCSLSFQI